MKRKLQAHKISITRSFCVLALVLGEARGFDTLVNVEQCTKSKLVISTYEATDNGLVFIQGQDERCKHETVEKEDDSSQNLTVKPSARMSFYKVVSEEEVSGKEVKLTDTLIMALQLDDQFTDRDCCGSYLYGTEECLCVQRQDGCCGSWGDFDIKARYCIASDIVIIENLCSTDTDLFPNFSRFKTGYLMSQFGAFRATNLQGEALEMNFTCVLEVCKEACEETFCGGGETGWGRKQREINGVISEENGDGVISPKKQNRRQANYDIGVGGKVKIVERYSDIKIITEETVCMSSAVLITLLVFLSAGFVVTFTSAIVFYRKWMTAQSQTNSVQLRTNCIQKMANSAVKGKY